MTHAFGPKEDSLGEVLDRKILAVKVGSRLVGPTFPVYLIAEAGINHQGDLKKAKALIDASAAAGCHAVKFQKRSLTDLYTPEVLENPNRFEESFQYLIPLLKEVEFGREEYDELCRHARSKGLEFLCTASDEPSVDFLEPYGLPAYKVASGDLTNLLLLEKLARKRKPLLLSTGMSSLEELDQVVEFLWKRRVTFALLHCVSAYPTPPEDMHLNFIQTMRERYGVPIGFSAHEVGFEITLAAVAAGACIVERHITLDHKEEGPDHSSSLEPREFQEMVRRVRLIERALGSSRKGLSRVVIRSYEILAKSLVAATDIPEGTEIHREMVAAKSPGKGLSPLHLSRLVGRRLRRTVRRDECFKLEDLEEQTESTRNLQFQTRWGFKGRFHDLDGLLSHQPKLVEIQLNDRDLDYPFEEAHRGKHYPFALYLHCPIYWFRSVLNLASENEAERKEHLQVVQRVIDMARKIAPFFDGTPSVVIHLGGMDIIEVRDGSKLRALAYDSMQSLNWDGVDFLPENMPPRPWYLAGQWFDNAFCSAEDMVEVCEKFRLKMCLDLSHAKLYTNYTGTDYWEYLRKTAPHTGHLHIADAYGLDGEGVQIGEGEVDFAKAFSILEQYGDMKNISWTPEIWQGHLHQNKGFLAALDRLAGIPQLRADPPVESGNGSRPPHR